MDVVGLVSKYVAGGFDGTLIVEPGQVVTLEANRQYEFIDVVVQSGGKLTVNPYDRHSQSGGTLILRALKSVVVEYGGQINLFGKGYRGGRDYSVFGGGGGYGTRGESNTALRRLQNGGDVYGDETLSVLHLGSGGGGGFGQVPGGNGGGAIKIECVRLRVDGEIKCNGGHCIQYTSGGGSGGSIFLRCHRFEMSQSGSIQACGGKNRWKKEERQRGGEGGDGRIRILTNDDTANIQRLARRGQIVPKPYIG